MNPLDALVKAANQFVQAAGGGDPVAAAQKAGELATKLSQGDFIGATVGRITILSEYTQPFTLTANDLKQMAAAKPDPNSPLKLWGKFIKPTVIIESPLLAKPYAIAPYGKADPNVWKSRQALLKWGLIGGIGLAFASVFFLGRASVRRSAA